MTAVDTRVRARDGYPLAASRIGGDADTVILVCSATAVPRQFYRHFCRHLAASGFAAVSFDYRGIGESRPPEGLRGFEALMRDWAFEDMAALVDWVHADYAPRRLIVVGHSFGGQALGLLPNAGRVDALVGVSSQSGYWAIQGGVERLRTGLGVYLLMPLLSRLFGYFPWSRLAAGEDLPKGVALEWASWSRNPRYLLGDDSLPLERYAEFRAPVLAYSIDDDNWGSARAVDAMMSAYPNVERRHLVPADRGLPPFGHMGFFRPQAEPVWNEVIDWINALA